jgi:hypothetical protein
MARIRFMKQSKYYFQVCSTVFGLTVWLLGMASQHALAATPPVLATPPGLSISQLKITGDEFLVITNNSSNTISNLSSYWLYVFNTVNPLATGISSSSQQLPTTSLGAGQTVLLSANGMATCGATVAGKLSVSLTDSSGFLQLVQMGMSASGVTQTAIDAVSWNSSTTGIIQSVPSNSKDPNALYYRYQAAATPASFGWQLADLDTQASCKYNVIVGAASIPITTAPTGLATGSATPPVTIEVLDGTGASTDPEGTGDPASRLPASDIGLLAPIINELLPNPASPQSDASDEFIELYNPNDSPFDLTGFSLQVGSVTSTAAHAYSFPQGTKINAKSFVAYKSAQTKLSMSNTAGQVWLIDAFSNVVGQTADYSTAQDGQAWALANGSWYWTSTPTPGSGNKMTVAAKVAGKSMIKLTTKASTNAAVRAPSKTPAKTSAKASVKTTTKKIATGSAAKKKKAATTKSSTANAANVAVVTPRPIHNTILVAVALLAVLYGLYEYRHDLANAVYRLRTHRTAGRKARQETEGR